MTTPAPDAPARRDADATRRRLMRAALDLFTTEGFRGTTTPMLAARAGIAEGTIYRHFPSKEALLNTAFRETQLWAGEVVKAAEAERTARAPERLRQVGRRLLAEAVAWPAAVRMLLQAQDAQYLDDASRAAARAFRDGLQRIVASGKSDGVVRAGPAELWAAIWLEIVAFAADRVAGGEWGLEHPQAALTLDAAWDAIAAPARDGLPAPPATAER